MSYPPTPPPGPPYPYPYAAIPKTNDKAVVSLVLGVVSLVFSCGLITGIPAMVLAQRAKQEIRDSQGAETGEGLASAGFWTGLIGTVLTGLALLAVVAVFAFGILAEVSNDSTCTTFRDGVTTDC